MTDAQHLAPRSLEESADREPPTGSCSTIRDLKWIVPHLMVFTIGCILWATVAHRCPLTSLCSLAALHSLATDGTVTLPVSLILIAAAVVVEADPIPLDQASTFPPCPLDNVQNLPPKEWPDLFETVWPDMCNFHERMRPPRMCECEATGRRCPPFWYWGASRDPAWPRIALHMPSVTPQFEKWSTNIAHGFMYRYPFMRYGPDNGKCEDWSQPMTEPGFAFYSAARGPNIIAGSYRSPPSANRSGDWTEECHYCQPLYTQASRVFYYMVTRFGPIYRGNMDRVRGIMRTFIVQCQRDLCPHNDYGIAESNPLGRASTVDDNPLPLADLLDLNITAGIPGKRNDNLVLMGGDLPGLGVTSQPVPVGRATFSLENAYACISLSGEGPKDPFLNASGQCPDGAKCFDFPVMLTNDIQSDVAPPPSLRSAFTTKPPGQPCGKIERAINWFTHLFGAKGGVDDTFRYTLFARVTLQKHSVEFVDMLCEPTGGLHYLHARNRTYIVGSTLFHDFTAYGAALEQVNGTVAVGRWHYTVRGDDVQLWALLLDDDDMFYAANGLQHPIDVRPTQLQLRVALPKCTRAKLTPTGAKGMVRPYYLVEVDKPCQLDVSISGSSWTINVFGASLPLIELEVGESVVMAGHHLSTPPNPERIDDFSHLNYRIRRTATLWTLLDTLVDLVVHLLTDPIGIIKECFVHLVLIAWLYGGFVRMHPSVVIPLGLYMVFFFG